MPPSRASWVFACLLASALAPAGILPAQQAAEHHGIFSETIDVTLVNLEIIATDERGRVVTDLTREEFRIFEDGEPVAIDYFTPARPLDPPKLETVPDPEPGVPAALPEAPPERHHAVILVDNAHLSPATRNALLARMRRQLPRFMGGDTWVMVINKDRDIRIERRFTNDLALVDSALERIQSTAQSGGMTFIEERTLRKKIEDGPSGQIGEGSTALFEDEGLQTALETHSGAHLFAQSVAQQVFLTCEVLGRFVDSLSGVPGRKALFYVSDGLPMLPGDVLFRQWWEKYGAAYADEAGMISPQDSVQEYDTSDAVLELIADAAANRVAFYPIDTSREPGSRSVAAAHTTATMAEQMLSLGSADQLALGWLAKGTGGESILDPAGVGDLMDRAQRDFASAYALGFVSRFRGDGKVHEVEVRSNRDGVDLRYIDRYRSKSSDQLMTDRTLAALILDEASNPLGARVELGDATEAGGARGGKRRRGRPGKRPPGSYVVPVVVRLPLANLSLVPEATAHSGSLTLILVVQDGEGRTSPPIKIAVPVEIPHEKLLASMNQMVGYKTELELRGGEQKIALGIRDDISQIASTLNLVVNVGDS